jgi:hypothetical protein
MTRKAPHVCARLLRAPRPITPSPTIGLVASTTRFGYVLGVSSETYELNCPFCDKLYKLPREKVVKHVGKSIHCRRCGKPFSIPAIPHDDFDETIPVAVPLFAQPPAKVTSAPPPPPPAEPPPVQAAHDDPVPAETPAADSTVVETADVETAVVETAVIETGAALETFLNKHAAADASSYGLPADPWPVTEPVAEEHAHFDPPAPVFADSSPMETEEPIAPSLSEDVPQYTTEQPIAVEEAPSGIAVEHEDEPIAASEIPVHEHAPEEAFDEPPPVSSYFAAEQVTVESVPTVIDEPPAIVESEPVVETSLVESEPTPATQAPGTLDLSDTATAGEAISASEEASEPTEEDTIEAPPPHLPPVPVMLPPTQIAPKLRARPRTAVAPVFDAVSEEPVPRRGGLSAETPRVVESFDAAAPPAEEIEPATDQPSENESPITESVTADEPVLPHRIDREQPALSEHSEPFEHIAVSEPDLGLRVSALASTSIHDASAAASTELSPMSLSDRSIADLSVIRRFTALLAIMSVVIALVLVAILLAIMGILPKK